MVCVLVGLPEGEPGRVHVLPPVRQAGFVAGGLGTGQVCAHVECGDSTDRRTATRVAIIAFFAFST